MHDILLYVILPGTTHHSSVRLSHNRNTPVSHSHPPTPPSISPSDKQNRQYKPLTTIPFHATKHPEKINQNKMKADLHPLVALFITLAIVTASSARATTPVAAPTTAKAPVLAQATPQATAKPPTATQPAGKAPSAAQATNSAQSAAKEPAAAQTTTSAQPTGKAPATAQSSPQTAQPTTAKAATTAPAHHHPQVQSGPDQIEATCKLTNHPNVCIQALTPEPLAHKSDAKQLGAITIRLAYQNATETIGYITGAMDQAESEPNTQQCLTDCNEQYIMAIEQLDDASAALDDNVNDPKAKGHAIEWIQAAMSFVKSCQEGCKEGAEHKNVMTKRNGHFNKLCSISISIISSLK